MGFGSLENLIKKLSDIKDIPPYQEGKVLSIVGGNPAWITGGTGGGGATYTEVSTYANLPDATTVTGEIYVVVSTTGIWGFRKLAGFYKSIAGSWVYLGAGDWVDIATDQTIGGTKTFSGSVIVPDAITAGQAVNKGQLDSISLTPGPAGATGADGISVQSAVINGSGNLIITLSNGNTIDTGHAVGATGIQGLQGIGIQSVTVDSNGNLILTLTDSSTIDAGLVKGADGAVGATGQTGATGPSGPGVPTGGTAGQALIKTDDTDFNTHWGVPDPAAHNQAWSTITDKPTDLAGYGITATSFSGGFNTLLVDGYYKTTGAGQTDAPNSINNFLIHVIAWSSTFLTQYATILGTPITFQRSCSAGTWSAWKQLATTDNPSFTGIVTTGGQIKFPATQNPSADVNTLDDYEEGSFTPVVIGTTTAGTGTYTTQLGKYTKIGNEVVFKLALAWTAHTGTGNLRISGLPFTSDAISVPCSVYANGLTFSGQLTPLISGGSATIIMYQSVTNTTPTECAMDTVVSQLNIQGSYQV